MGDQALQKVALSIISVLLTVRHQCINLLPWSLLVLGRTLKYRTWNLPNLQKSNLEPTEPLICSLKSNLEPTEPPKNRTEPRTLLNRMRKNWWFFEFFLSKPNLEPTEPLVGPQKPNLEPTEPQKTERTSEPNQVRPNTTLGNNDALYWQKRISLFDFTIVVKTYKACCLMKEVILFHTDKGHGKDKVPKKFWVDYFFPFLLSRVLFVFKKVQRVF